MSRAFNRPAGWLLAGLCLLVFVLSLTPIRSYDFFWHLATGRWIVEQRSLPETDPFAVGSDERPWINGEWLFQAGLFAAHRVVGAEGITILAAMGIAMLFAGLWLAFRGRVDPFVAGGVLLGCVVGARHRLGASPETAGIMLFAVALALAAEPVTTRTTVALAAVVIAWINIHPSALLGPVIVAAGLAGDLGTRDGPREMRIAPRLWQLVACTVALLANPYFVEGIMAPVRLAGFLRAEGITNLEWTATDPRQFPMVYASALGAVGLIVAGRRQGRWITPALLTTFLAVLAIRFVRNHGFYWVALPILLRDFLPGEISARTRRAFAVVLPVLVIAVIAGSRALGLGPDRGSFPFGSVARLRELGLSGNIYNPDQFGGFLIWSFYPERRVLTDGRNELYATFLAEYEVARNDSRAWQRLIRKHDLVLAVEEYRRDPIEVIDAVTGGKRMLPASSVYFPRGQWALIAWDDVGMVFARRDRFPDDLLQSIEYRSVVPDGSSLSTVLIGDPRSALEEVSRAVEETGRSRRASRIAGMILRGVQSGQRGDDDSN